MAARQHMRGHVALVLPDLRVGGAQKVFLKLARSFVSFGLEVDLVVALNDGELIAELPEGVRLIPLKQSAPYFGRLGLAVSTFIFLAIYLRRQRPDAMLSTLTGTNLVAVAAHFASRASTRLILREAATFENLRHPIYLFCMRLLYCRADCLITLTSVMRTEAIRFLGMPAAKVVQIPNPVDIEQIRNKSDAQLPADFDVSAPFIIAVGRLWPQKDYSTMIRAFAAVSSDHALRLVIIGEGPERAKLESLIAQLSLGKLVHLRGFDANPYRWMVRSQMLLLTSKWEGYPNVVLEAQALGVPIVMTEYDHSVTDIGGDNVEFAKVGDVPSILQAIMKSVTKSPPHTSEPPARADSALAYLSALGLSASKAVPEKN